MMYALLNLVSDWLLLQFIFFLLLWLFGLFSCFLPSVTPMSCRCVPLCHGSYKVPDHKIMYTTQLVSLLDGAAVPFITFPTVTAVTQISITLSFSDITVPLLKTVHFFLLSHVHHQVWNAMIPHLPLRVLLQNLKRLGRLWFIKGNQPIVAKILDALNNQSAIGESNLHPAHVFVTLRNYESLGKYVPHFLHIPIHAL